VRLCEGSGSTRRTLGYLYPNYALDRASTPGEHHVSFQLQEYAGFRFRHVAIDTRTGLGLTREPPYSLRLFATAHPSKVVAGSTTRVEIVMRNVGNRPAKHVEVQAVVDRRLRIENPAALASWPTIPPNRGVRRRLSVHTSTPGQRTLQLAAGSSQGSDLAAVTLDVRPRAERGGANGALMAASVVPLGGLALVFAKRRRRR
jgi:hypothetical protein